MGQTEVDSVRRTRKRGFLLEEGLLPNKRRTRQDVIKELIKEGSDGLKRPFFALECPKNNKKEEVVPEKGGGKRVPSRTKAEEVLKQIQKASKKVSASPDGTVASRTRSRIEDDQGAGLGGTVLEDPLPDVLKEGLVKKRGRDEDKAVIKSIPAIAANKSVLPPLLSFGPPRTRSSSSFGMDRKGGESLSNEAPSRERAEECLKQMRRTVTQKMKGVADRTRSKAISEPKTSSAKEEKEEKEEKEKEKKEEKEEEEEEGDTKKTVQTDTGRQTELVVIPSIEGPLTRRKSHASVEITGKRRGMDVIDREEHSVQPNMSSRYHNGGGALLENREKKSSKVVVNSSLGGQKSEHKARANHVRELSSVVEEKGLGIEEEGRGAELGQGSNGAIISSESRNGCLLEPNFGERIMRQFPRAIGLLTKHTHRHDKALAGKYQGRRRYDSSIAGRLTRSMRLGGTKKVSQDACNGRSKGSEEEEEEAAGGQIGGGQQAHVEKHGQKNPSHHNMAPEMKLLVFETRIAEESSPPVACTSKETQDKRTSKGFCQKLKKQRPTVGEKQSPNGFRMDGNSTLGYPSDEDIANVERAKQKAPGRGTNGSENPKKIFGNIVENSRKMAMGVASLEEESTEQSFQGSVSTLLIGGDDDEGDVPLTLRRKQGKFISDAGKDFASRGGPSPIVEKKEDDGTFWVATNPRHTGGWQMRPRPLDLNQPLSVVVEGSDEGHFQEEGISFCNISQLEQEEHGKEVEHVGKLTSEAGEGLREAQKNVLIPPFCVLEEFDVSPSLSEARYKIPDAYIRYTPPIKGRKKAEYDMDNEDQLWLQAHNLSKLASGSLKSLHEDQFEAAIDFFENETAWLRRSRFHAGVISRDQGGLNQDQSFEEEFLSRVPKSFQECCICNGGENSPSNPVFKCSCCHIVVHRYCYGIRGTKHELRDGYRCKRCVGGQADPNLTCALCLKSGGAFTLSLCRTKWVHVVCALYTNETYFVDPDMRELVDGLDAAEVRVKKQKRRRCCICRACEGSQEWCSVKGCYATFHVSCGVNLGASFELQESNRRIVQVQPFCPKHASASPAASAQEGEGFANEEQRLDTSSRKSSCQKKKKQPISSAVSEDLPLLPRAGNVKAELEAKYKSTKLPHDRVYPSLEEALETNAAPRADVQLLYWYWLLKRVKSEGPLLHRLQLEQSTETYGIFNKDSTLERSDHHRFSRSTSHPRTQEQRIWSFQVQLQKLRQLIKLVLHREVLKMQLFLVNRDIAIMQMQAIRCGRPLCTWCKGAHSILSCTVCRCRFCFQCFKSKKGYGVRNWAMASKSPEYMCLECLQKDRERLSLSTSSDPKLEVILHGDGDEMDATDPCSNGSSHHKAIENNDPHVLNKPSCRIKEPFNLMDSSHGIIAINKVKHASPPTQRGKG